MHTKSYTTIVAMPNNSNLEVTYYCMDDKLSEKEKENKRSFLYNCMIVSVL